MHCQSWSRANVVLFVGVTLAGSARAQTPPADAARAETLFQSGRQLLREGRFAEACPKLEESQSLDPAPGTRLNLADCWEHAGRTASAQREFLAVAETAEKNGENERAAIARARAKQLETRITKLALVLPAQAHVPGLQLFRNAVVVAEADWNTAQPVDPGRFVIEARAPGRRSYKNEFTLQNDAATHSLAIPPLASNADMSAESPKNTGPGASRGEWLERGGIGLAGLGVVGLGVGALFGVRAVSLYHRSQDEGCDERSVCAAAALETRHSAVQSGNVSTLSFVVGGALLAGGVGLYVWGSRENASDGAGLRARIAPLPGGGFLAASRDF